MPRSILVVATRYDVGTYYTHSWAKTLQEDSMRKGHNCILLDAESLCHSGSTLREAIERVDYVIFYGHGLRDQWTAMPSSSSAGGVAERPLIDTNNVSVLDGRQVYAGCCHSLTQLGQSFVTICSGEYVGYSQRFQFETTNHQDFGDVVNTSVMAYVAGDSASKVVTDLANDWDRLRLDFVAGRLRKQPNAIMAAQCADDNRQRVGSLP